MKQSTCKILIGVGTFFIILGFLMTIMFSKEGKNFPAGMFLIPYLFVGAIFILIGWAKWDSEEEVKDIKKAKLDMIRRGRATIELKGKMKKT